MSTSVTASPPSKGAGRDLARGLTGLFVGAIVAGLAGMSVELDAQTVGTITVLVMLGLSSALAALGKHLRQKGGAFQALGALLILSLVLSLGCGAYANKHGAGVSIGQTDVIVDDEGAHVNGESLSANFTSILGPIVGLAARFGLGAAGVPVPAAATTPSPSAPEHHTHPSEGAETATGD